MRLTAAHRGADVITGEVGRLPAFTPLVSIAGAVVVAVNMVPSFESAGGQPGLGPGLSWLKARRSASLTLFTDRHGLRSRLLSSSLSR
jgi:hypothetical protein